MVLMSQCFNTASGRYCCNSIEDFTKSLVKDICVSIPQAVGTVATRLKSLQHAQVTVVSIPQAVGTVATTVYADIDLEDNIVSIPQAVGTVATRYR